MARSRHSPTPSRRALARLVRGLGPLLAVSCSACSPAPPASQRTFQPNEITVSLGRACIELVGAEYGAQTTTLELKVENRGRQVVTIDGRGILLAYDGLEYPTDGRPRREPVELAPHGSRRIELEFRLGRPLEAQATLYFRSVRVASKWHDSVAMAIPAAAGLPTP